MELSQLPLVLFLISNIHSEQTEERPKAKVSIKPDQHVFRGEKVTLRCDIDGEGVTSWKYSWYKDGSVSVFSELQEHTFSSVTESDAGKYSCYGAEREGSRSSQHSDAVALTVSGEFDHLFINTNKFNMLMSDISISDRPRAVLSGSPQKWLTEGDPVTLICEVKDSSTGWTFSWCTVSSQFSILHIMVLVLCIVSAFGALLLLCCLIYCPSNNTACSSRTNFWTSQVSLVFCPNICMFFAFIFWGFTKGFDSEIITCCALYILRPVMYLTVFYVHEKSARFRNMTHLFLGICFGCVVVFCLKLCRGFSWMQFNWISSFFLSLAQFVEQISSCGLLRSVHPSHMIMYMSGAVGLVLLNSGLLTAELFLETWNGERIIKDLRIIVFPCECVLALYWIINFRSF
uniref:Ig-like domain-containing protein n=1 Tax=Cyprinus carpio carpio TaxID=630221 RepID=A0A9J7Z5B3_CYPCA